MNISEFERDKPKETLKQIILPGGSLRQKKDVRKRMSFTS